ncbi:PfkB family carbohydrate kinase [Brevibacillus ginsengisoli]|uniref:PfkB family carbohydrate kinase n=1 Tax=Brevibacillus ginsengisoli TaxID=363854 RepID=UPI003CF6B258
MNSPLVSAIGVVFVDCKGFANQNYQAQTRNLGSIQFVHGGVVRNVVENLARLSVPTSFVTMIDESAMGKEVVDKLESLHIKTNHIAYVKEKGMGWWLALLNEHGNLAGSISQMPELSAFEDYLIRHGEEIVKNSRNLVLELDMNYPIVKRIHDLAAKYQVPLYGIPGNLDVIMRHRDVLNGLACFICNNYEVDMLLGRDFSNQPLETKLQLLQELVHETRLQRMIVTLGAHGAVYYDSLTGDKGHQTVFPVQLIDSSGAGDSFFSGAVASLARGASIGEAAFVGTKVAGWTVEHPASNCPDLDVKIKNDEEVKEVLLKETVSI